MIGLAADVALLVIPGFESLLARSGLLVSAVILNALATALYIGAGFGAGPRDGLMTGIHARTGWPVRRIRTAIEVSVLLIGWLLGNRWVWNGAVCTGYWAADSNLPAMVLPSAAGAYSYQECARGTIACWRLNLTSTDAAGIGLPRSTLRRFFS